MILSQSSASYKTVFSFHFGTATAGTLYGQKKGVRVMKGRIEREIVCVEKYRTYCILISINFFNQNNQFDLKTYFTAFYLSIFSLHQYQPSFLILSPLILQSLHLFLFLLLYIHQVQQHT